MRLLAAICLIKLSLAPPAPGQTSGPANGGPQRSQSALAGPNLPETINFLHDIYRRQSPLTTPLDAQSTRTDEEFSFDQVAECQVRTSFLRTTQHASPGLDGSPFHKEKIVSIISLAISDPLSVKVVPGQGSLVVISKAIMLRGRVALDVDLSRPVLDLPKSSSSSVEGFVLTASPTEIIFMAGNGNRYRISLPLKKDVVTKNRQQPDAITNVQAGDYITHRRDGSKVSYDYSSPSLSSQLAHGAWTLPETFAEVSLPPLAEEETANRIAKALIHAMVLCHKDEKPSPF